MSSAPKRTRDRRDGSDRVFWVVLQMTVQSMFEVRRWSCVSTMYIIRPDSSERTGRSFTRAWSGLSIHCRSRTTTRGIPVARQYLNSHYSIMSIPLCCRLTSAKSRVVEVSPYLLATAAADYTRPCSRGVCRSLSGYSYHFAEEGPRFVPAHERHR